MELDFLMVGNLVDFSAILDLRSQQTSNSTNTRSIYTNPFSKYLHFVSS